MINILFSGISKEHGFNNIQSECLKECIKDNSVITFISSDFNDIAKSNKYSNDLINWFNDIGIKFRKINLIDKNISKDTAHKMLESSDIVFLMGGSPYLQMCGINDYDLVPYIKNIPLVIGVSAGSMNQSKRVVYEDEDYEYKLYDYEGLGLIDFNIYPHLDFNDIELLKETFRVSEYLQLEALPNDSFIMVKNDNIKYYGSHYKVYNNEIDISGHDIEKIIKINKKHSI